MRLKQSILWGVAILAAVVSAPLLGSDRTYAAVQLPTGNENTVILVQNVGDQDATFVADYFTPAGTIIPEATETFNNIAPGGVANIAQATNPGLPTGYRGLAVISSTEEINTLIVRDILAAGNVKSYSIASAFSSGGEQLALPIVFNELMTAQWNSRVAIVNTGGSLACIRVTYTLLAGKGGSATENTTVVDSPTGQAGCANGHALNGGGQITFGRAGTGVTDFPVNTRDNQMAALVEVLNPNGDNLITANVDIYRSDGNRLFGSYNGLIIPADGAQSAGGDVGTDVIAPLAIKSVSGFYTLIGVQNVGDAPANVQIQYIGTNVTNGQAVDLTVNLNNVAVTAEHSVYSAGPNVPIGFVGYARVTSDQPLAVIEVRGKLTTSNPPGPSEPIYSAFNAVPVAGATEDWNLPLIFRRFSPGVAPSVGFNSWIQVQVADGGSAQVTLRFVGDPVRGGACPVGPYERTFTVNGSFVFLMNDNNTAINGFPAGNVPNCFFGGAQVTASEPVIVISNVTSDKFPNSDSEGTYNGFPAN